MSQTPAAAQATNKLTKEEPQQSPDSSSQQPPDYSIELSMPFNVDPTNATGTDQEKIVFQDKTSFDIHRHQLRDLSRTATRGTGIFGWFHALFNDVAYYSKWLVRTWFNVAVSLPNYIVDPVGLNSVLLFASLSTLFLGGALVVSAFWRLPFVQKIWYDTSKRRDVGLANFSYPEIFDLTKRSQRIRDAAFDVMSKPLKQANHPSSDGERVCHLEVAKVLMMLSSLVYERDTNTYHDAAKATAKLLKKNKEGYQKFSNLGNDAKSWDHDVLSISNQLIGADRRIYKVAAKWGLKYMSVSELGTNTSPLCGAFWNPDYNFIILAFKGTNPVEFKEWALNMTFQYTDGRGWLRDYTKVHRGFYDSIFPQDISRAKDAFPHTQIRKSVARISAEIQAKNGNKPVNLYITGHSLGAALACILYSRAIQSPKDFGKNAQGVDFIHVQDAYCFGCPVIGDPDCVSAFNLATHDYLKHPIGLWRITNRGDAVATLLPQAGDRQVFAHISPMSQFHYSHIGQEIKMEKNGRVAAGPGTQLSRGTVVSIKTQLDKNGLGPKVELDTIFHWLENIPFIGRFVRHLPSSYWSTMSQIESEDDISWAH